VFLVPIIWFYRYQNSEANLAGFIQRAIEADLGQPILIVDLIRAGKIQLVLYLPLGPHAHTDGVEIRKAAIAMNVLLLTTLSAAMAAVSAIQALEKKELKYRRETRQKASCHCTRGASGFIE